MTSLIQVAKKRLNFTQGHWTLDQNRRPPPTAMQTLSGCTWMDKRHFWAAAPGFQTGPTWRLVWKLWFWWKISHAVVESFFISTWKCFNAWLSKWTINGEFGTKDPVDTDRKISTDLHSNPHLQFWDLGLNQKNEIADTSGPYCQITSGTAVLC